MSVCVFVYFAHDFDRVLIAFIKIRVCVFVRLRLWEGGCQFGLFWGHSDARVRHIQTLPALPSAILHTTNYSDAKVRHKQTTPHYQLHRTTILDQI